MIGNASGGARATGVLLFTVWLGRFSFADNPSAQHQHHLRLHTCDFGCDVAFSGGIVRSFTTNQKIIPRLEMEDLVSFANLHRPMRQDI